MDWSEEESDRVVHAAKQLPTDEVWQVFAEKTHSELISVDRRGISKTATASRVGTSIDHYGADGLARSFAAPGIVTDRLVEPAILAGLAELRV